MRKFDNLISDNNRANNEIHSQIIIDHSIDDYLQIHNLNKNNNNNEYDKSHQHCHHPSHVKTIKIQQSPNQNITKCAKMTEENGMIRNGSLNGVGIANIASSTTSFNYSSGSTTSTAAATITTTTTSSVTTTVTSTASSTANAIVNLSQSGSRNHSQRNALVNGIADESSTSSVGSNNKLPNATVNGQPGNPIGGRLQFFKGNFCSPPFPPSPISVIIKLLGTFRSVTALANILLELAPSQLV